MNQPIRVIHAEYVEGYKIALTFNDGVHKIVDLSHSLSGKVFEPLKEVGLFRGFKLNFWTIEWENGADLAPEYLYSL